MVKGVSMLNKALHHEDEGQ